MQITQVLIPNQRHKEILMAKMSPACWKEQQEVSRNEQPPIKMAAKPSSLTTNPNKWIVKKNTINSSN